MSQMHILDGLDLEVQADKTEDETFQVLHQVVEHAEAFRVPANTKASRQ